MSIKENQGLKKWIVPQLINRNELIQLEKVREVIVEEDEYFIIKQELNSAKSNLDKLDPKTYLRNFLALDAFGSSFKKMISNTYNLTITTNASLKMFEMLSQFPLIDCKFPVKVFCNAELPGAFIVAINHYIRSKFPDCDFDWVASSYLPTEINAKNSTILEDKYNIYSKNREKWLMGPKPNAITSDLYTNGDVTSKENIKILSSSAKEKLGDIHLYTSDAGIDVSEDYNNQEEMTMLLNFGQCLCGLLSICVGGSLVTKQYTFFHPFNRSLILLMSSLFDEFYITKPATSRPANSEIYLVGLSFRGISEDLSSKLLDRIEDYAKIKPSLWSPLIELKNFTEIDEILIRISRSLFIDTQVKYLNTLSSFNATELETRKVNSLKIGITRQWLADNPIEIIPKSLAVNS